ncbi:GNAT family N-acetyltransferase [Sinorhizobium saheli]|uniref:Cellulose biosynthesis protein CelD n=1 Tax=Sinorhizobium saheli TaxID=36856 RepID=A0A178XU95_SINSA|nr:GNAT family N-acetyltransferase [Sinorhizobium saheli]MQW90199.1 GNAT family N-acetyltransferase [Sinorhizobium saheli]OAP38777.1 cellulose biosynthesis protein CelD [Sinorhizobium saheli]
MPNTDFILAPLSNAMRHVSAAQAERCDTDRIAMSVHSDMVSLEAEWRALDESNRNSLFQSFDWCAAWKATHKSDLRIVRGTIGGRLLFLLPFEVERRAFFRTARLIGSEHSNLNTGLFGSGIDGMSQGEIAAALTTGLARALRRFADVVVLDRMPAAWRGAAHPLAGLPANQNPNASFQLPLLGTVEHTLVQINARRRRKKMRLSERRLAEMGGYDYVIARESGEALALLETFFRQKAARFEAQGLPDAFRTPETRAFFHALIDAGASAREDRRPLEMNAIRLKGAHEGRVVAISGIARKGDHVVCQFGSIDEFAADSSPGELLYYRMIERFCADGVTLFDFGIGDQAYKRSWCTIETPLQDIILPMTARGYLAAAAHRTAAGAKRAIKANKTLYAFVQRQRQRRQATASATDTEDG